MESVVLHGKYMICFFLRLDKEKGQLATCKYKKIIKATSFVGIGLDSNVC